MPSEKLQPWATPLLLSSTLTQATIYVLRPMITYRAIELDGNSAQIGLIAALYAHHTLNRYRVALRDTLYDRISAQLYANATPII